MSIAGLQVPSLWIVEGEKTIDAGEKQSGDYIDWHRADEGYMIIFDSSPKISWKKNALSWKINFWDIP